MLQALKVLAQPARKATAGKAHGTREDGKSKAAKPKAKVEEIKDDDDDDADSASDPEV